MKTARFAEIVKQCGEPEPHLLLIEPAKDPELQKAIKAKRVMTVFQDSVGSKADRGLVGFEAGSGRQFLIFPKSLKAFEGKQVVGIKYELWSQKEPAKSERAAPFRPPAKKKPAHKAAEWPSNVVVLPDLAEERGRSQERKEEEAPAERKTRGEAEPRREPKSRVLEKKEVKPRKKAKAEAKPERVAPNEQAVETVAQIKERVREAMESLEQGKQVAAFNLLKRIVED